MQYWDFPHSAFSGQIYHDRLTSTHKQNNWLCRLSPGGKVLTHISQTWQRCCRKEDPFKPTENWPQARRETWETARRGTTQPFPPTLQLHKRPGAQHGQPGRDNSGHQELNNRCKRTLLTGPRCLHANHWWAHLGITRTVVPETSRCTAPLSPTARLFSWTGGDSAIQRLRTPSTDLKRNHCSMGLEQQLTVKKGHYRWFWWAFVKNFQQGTVIFCRSEQGSAADRNALQQTALEQIHSCTVPRVNRSLGRAAHPRLCHRHTEEHRPSSSSGGGRSYGIMMSAK